MDDTMKKRLVGAVVLVSLAVIFVPMLLEEKEQPLDSVNLEKEIPKEPTTDYRADLIPTGKAARDAAGQASTSMEIPLETSIESQQPVAVEPVTSESMEKSGSKKKNEWVIVEDKPKTVAMVNKPKASQARNNVTKTTPVSRKGWSIQAGSFGKKSNAENLMAKLKLNGMDSYISPVQIQDKTLYRVRVGPLANKKKAQQQLKLVEKHFNLKGKVLPP